MMDSILECCICYIIWLLLCKNKNNRLDFFRMSTSVICKAMQKESFLSMLAMDKSLPQVLCVGRITGVQTFTSPQIDYSVWGSTRIEWL